MNRMVTCCIVAVCLLFLPVLLLSDSVFLQIIISIFYPHHSPLVPSEEYTIEALWYTSASASDDSNGDEENDDEENGDEENGETSGGLPGLPRNPQMRAPPPSLTPTPHNLAPRDLAPRDLQVDPGATPDDPSHDVGPRSIDPGATSPSDGAGGPITTISNACMIAMDLSRLPPPDIRFYPTSQFSGPELESIFQCLTPSNLAKVLLNVPPEDLRSMQTRLGFSAFELFLDRIHILDKTEIQRRLSFSMP
jgi:hypothetical protein